MDSLLPNNSIYWTSSFWHALSLIEYVVCDIHKLLANHTVVYRGFSGHQPVSQISTHNPFSRCEVKIEQKCGYILICVGDGDVNVEARAICDVCDAQGTGSVVFTVLCVVAWRGTRMQSVGKL